MSRAKRTNLCRDQRCDLTPSQQVPRGTPTCAADLTEGQLWLLVEQAIRQGGHPADRCFSYFGFHPTDEDRREIEWAAGLYAEQWRPWTELLKRERTKT